MTTQFKNPINRFALVFLMLMAMLLLGFGCNPSKPTPDPLADFHVGDFRTLEANKSITDDYKSYIQKLPPEDIKYARMSGYYEDGMGQHAVVIEVDLNGTAWNHVLFYDKNNKRTKVIKYVGYHYMS